MLPNYFFFFCMPVLLLTRYLLSRAVTARTCWLVFAAVAVFVGAFEMPGINAASWKYYGESGLLSVNTYPVWVAFNNAQTLFTTAVAVHVLRLTVLKSSRSYLLIVLVPMIIAGAHMAPSLPVATATHSSSGTAVANWAAAITILLNLVIIWVDWLLIERCRGLRQQSG